MPTLGEFGTFGTESLGLALGGHELLPTNAVNMHPHGAGSMETTPVIGGNDLSVSWVCGAGFNRNAKSASWDDSTGLGSQIY
jgi:hypothetical protein